MECRIAGLLVLSMVTMVGCIDLNKAAPGAKTKRASAALEAGPNAAIGAEPEVGEAGSAGAPGTGATVAGAASQDPGNTSAAAAAPGMDPSHQAMVQHYPSTAYTKNCQGPEPEDGSSYQGPVQGKLPTPAQVATPGSANLKFYDLCVTTIANLLPFANAQGWASTWAMPGSVKLDGAFFQSLGSNGRSCDSCHDVRTGWTVTPALLEELFARSQGLAPVFRTVDGSVSPEADVSTLAKRRQAYQLLLGKGLIRVGLPIPVNAEFSLAKVEDPYGFASARELSLFRRPLPSANLRFLSTVMWDGRESHAGETVLSSLLTQANSATTGHAQGQPLSGLVRQEIVDFEMALFAAQAKTASGIALAANGARGGAKELSTQGFAPGINSPLNPATFDRQVFNLFSAWANATDSQQRSIARGQEIFNSRTFVVRGVKGLNDLAGVEALPLTCSGCHNTPNAGSSSIGSMMDLGLAAGERRTPDMPLYRLKNLSTGETVETTDPGRALVTGKWSDIGRFKVPTLRNLSARAPYFHNGAADSIRAVIEFYNARFSIGLTEQDKQDLEAFQSAL